MTVASFLVMPLVIPIGAKAIGPAMAISVNSDSAALFVILAGFFGSPNALS